MKRLITLAAMVFAALGLASAKARAAKRRGRGVETLAPPRVAECMAWMGTAMSGPRLAAD
jgi:hypothetical protein